MKSFVPLAILASSAFAKTDIDGCTSFTSMVTVRDEPGYGNTYASVVWYVPDSLEICKGVDCGGGRAPPKSVPGCPLYEGPETVTPEFLDSDPMKPTEAPESSIVKATAPETSTEAEETSTAEVEETTTATTTVASATETETETETVGTDESSSTVSTATSPDTSTITSVATSTVTTDASESTTEGGEGDEATTSSGTDTPGAAMPTAAVAANVVAGIAAAVAFL